MRNFMESFCRFHSACFILMLEALKEVSIIHREKGGSTCHRGLNYKTRKDFELNNGEQKYLVKDIEVYNIETIDID